MKALCLISEPAEIDKYGLWYEKDKIDVAFHTHIPYLLDCAKSISHAFEFRNYALQTLSNLAKREYLKPYILYNEGISVFLDALRNENNIAGWWISAKALANLTLKDEKLWIRIISELSEEVRKTWIHEQDSIISQYIR